jgi:hypothetical protein
VPDAESGKDENGEFNGAKLTALHAMRQRFS